MNNKPYLSPDSAANQFDGACFPVLLVNDRLDVLYANQKAVEIAPAFQFPDGLRTLIPISDASDWGELIRARISFQRNSFALLPSSVSLAFSPLQDENGHAFAYVFFVAAPQPVLDKNLSISQIRDQLMGVSPLMISNQLRRALSEIFCTLSASTTKLHQEEVYCADDHLQTMHRECFKLLRDAENIAQRARACMPLAETWHCVDFWSQCAELLDACDTVLREKGLNFSYFLPPTTNYVRCDFRQVSQAMMNVVSNAYVYGGHKVSVTVTGKDLGSNLMLTVCDNGPGIPGDLLAKIFEPYVAHENQFCTHAGLGLGLNVTRQLVTAMGGTVAVQSEEGRGTTIAVTFPTVSSEGAEDSMFRSTSTSYLKDRFSAVYIGLCNVVQPPLI